MKHFKKIIAVCLASAGLLTAFSGMTALADTSVTGEQLKALATKNTMEQNPYLNEILDGEFLQSDPYADITQAKSVKDCIDPKKAVRMVNYAYDITQFFKPGIGTAKSYEEAIEQYNKNETRYDYYMPAPQNTSQNTYDESDGRKSAYYVQVTASRNTDEVYTYASDDAPLYDFDREYDKAAELINKNNLGTPTEVLLFNETAAMGVTTEKGSYFLPFEEHVNWFAAYLDKPESKITPGAVYTVDEYNEYYSGYREDEKQARIKFGQRLHEAMPEAKRYDGQGMLVTEDTDSFSQYIGTSPRYSDVARSQAAVTNQMTDLGVITGEGGMFRPDNAVTRAEASAMLCRLFDLEQKSENLFSDVAASHWAASYIGALAAEGIVGGFEDGSFKPDENVTYEQVFKMVESLLGYTFEDNIWMHGYYPTGHIVVATELGLSDDLGSFNAGENISKIELACVLSRALDTHISTYDAVIYEFGAIYCGYQDITLSAYKNGGSLHGAWLRSDEAKQAFLNAFEKEYSEKCGAVIDEFVEKTGLNEPKEITGGITSGARSGNPIPRITQE